METSCEPFQKWTLVLISVNRKSSQMHSRTTKRILEKSNEWKLVRTKFVFAKTWLKKRWCLAKNPVVPSVFEMGNVELIASCSHYVFEGTLICRCGKQMRPNQDVMDRIKEALWLSQEVVNAVRTRGSNITTRLETHCEVLQKVKGHLPQSGTDGKMMRSTGYLWFLIIGQVLGPHRALQHPPQCAAIAERKKCEPASFTKCWRKQAGRTTVAKTRAPGSEKGTVKIYTNQKKTRTSSFCPSKWQKASTEQTWFFTGRVPGWLSIAKVRTPTPIIIFKMVTKPNIVEFVFMDSRLAEMAPARVARRQMVRPMVKYDNTKYTL